MVTWWPANLFIKVQLQDLCSILCQSATCLIMMALIFLIGPLSAICLNSHLSLNPSKPSIHGIIIVVVITWPKKLAFVLLFEHDVTGIQA